MPTSPLGLGDGDPDAGAGHRDQAGQDVEGVGASCAWASAACAAGVDSRSSRVRLEPVDLGLGALGGAGEAVEDVDQVLLAQPGVGVVDLVGPHLGDRGEAHDGEQDRHHDLGARRALQRRQQALRGRWASAGRPPVLGSGCRSARRAQAWNRCLRIAATLEKIRIPRTTMTPVESWPPTPSLSPR